jgi:hypothetical protein
LPLISCSSVFQSVGDLLQHYFHLAEYYGQFGEWLNAPDDCAFVLVVLDAAPAGTQLCYSALTFISFIHVVSCLVQAHNVYFFVVHVLLPRVLMLNILSKVPLSLCSSFTPLRSGRN